MTCPSIKFFCQICGCSKGNKPVKYASKCLLNDFGYKIKDETKAPQAICSSCYIGITGKQDRWRQLWWRRTKLDDGMDRPCCPYDWSSIMVATCADGNPECYFVSIDRLNQRSNARNLVPVNQNHR